ncbi:hypothetical protein D3C73_762990 [compost metagenome]
MKKEQLDVFFNTITPTKTQKESMLNDILRKKDKSTMKIPTARGNWLGKRLAAAAFLIVVLSLSGTLIHSVSQPSFTMVAYAAEVKDGISESTRDNKMVEISDKAHVKLPFGMIARTSGPNESTDDDGNKVIMYDSGYDSSGQDHFSVIGKDIAHVTYTSELGKLAYTDRVMREQDQGYIQEQKKMAEAKKNGTTLFVARSPMGKAYYQYGKTVIAKYYAELGDSSFEISWTPWYALDLISTNGEISLTDLPKDTITIAVTFTNGKTVTKTMQLSFDSKGSLIAELKKT